MATVVFTGWNWERSAQQRLDTGWDHNKGRPGIAFVKLLMSIGYPLKEAKEIMDEVGVRVVVQVPTASVPEAHQLLQQARDLGAEGYIL